MGAEGWITFARVKTGHHLLTEDDPHFIIKSQQKIGIFYARAVLYGNRWTNFEFSSFEISWVARKYLDSSLRNLFGPLKKGIAGLITDRQTYLQYNPQDEHQHSDFESWDKFTPGVWIPVEYYEEGTDRDSYYRFERPGIVLENEIETMAWT